MCVRAVMPSASDMTASFHRSSSLTLVQRPPSPADSGAGCVGSAAGVTEAGLDPADLAWIVVTHIHLDHAGGVVRRFTYAELDAAGATAAGGVGDGPVQKVLLVIPRGLKMRARAKLSSVDAEIRSMIVARQM